MITKKERIYLDSAIDIVSENLDAIWYAFKLVRDDDETLNETLTNAKCRQQETIDTLKMIY